MVDIIGKHGANGKHHADKILHPNLERNVQVRSVTMDVGHPDEFGTMMLRQKIGTIGPFDLCQSTGGFQVMVVDPRSGVETRINFEAAFREAAEALNANLAARALTGRTDG